MALDLQALTDAVQCHERLARVVIADSRGSTPREAGTAMLVWADGQSGTIGGGSLESQAVAAARVLLAEPGNWLRHLRQVPLGPALGQCCGGAVTLLAEVFSAVEIDGLTGLAAQGAGFGRQVTSGIGPHVDIPRISPARCDGLKDGWMVEPFAAAKPPLWIYGAGHVGRALVAVLPGAGFDVTWIDTNADRFPALIPEGVCQLVAAQPAAVVGFAPPEALHLVLTYSHALDLEICHRILGHGFEFAGLIGSATKWARFRKRLAQLGHLPAQIGRITCPIGMPELGKAPESIAVGVTAQLLKMQAEGHVPSKSAKELVQ